MSGRWRYALASVRGTSHGKAGTACQDACAAMLLPLQGEKNALVLVAADGAGSARHGREGARLCCRTFLREAEALLADKDDVPADWTRADAEALLAAIRAEIAAEAVRCGEKERAFAATLLGAICGESAAAFFQVGDGGIVIGTPENGPEQPYRSVFWPQSGQYANETYFVTDRALALQFALRPGPVKEAALFTDGLQRLVLRIRERAAYEPFFRDLFGKLREKATAEGHARPLSGGLKRFLDGKLINSRTDDDKTLILATRLPPAGQEGRRNPEEGAATPAEENADGRSV